MKLGMRKILLWSSLLVTMLVIVFVTLSFYQSPVAVHRFLMAASTPLTVLRCSCYVALLLCWPMLMRHIAQRKHWEADYLAYAIAQRYRIFIWLVILELALGQNIIGRFVGIIF